MHNRTVMCFGLFNSLHAGHMRYLAFAKSLGQKVIIGLFSDEEKDHEAYSFLLKFDERKKVLLGSGLVDEIITTDRRSIHTVLDKTDPDIVVVGKPVSESEVNFFNELSGHLSNKASKIIIYSGKPQVFDLEIPNPLSAWSNLCATMEKHGVHTKDLYVVLDEIKNKRVAIIGDVIVDRYIASEALGISNRVFIR